MSYPLLFNQQANEEYAEAYLWYELKQKGLGERFMQCAEKRLNQISETPERYSKKYNLRFREVKVEDFPYMIVHEFSSKKTDSYCRHHTRK
ncbi:hypothetical protein A9P82_13915 [Arachidicoccus ginsenosidimutans]|uniref:type II toxin-antitoxin system RelE/ParE family toxin n=1 Tax=Arachidicoccus sp. BS20 TaxID=1850526 RepID=UPI0007F07AC8|nr:type II toxin-antitoxin system RelE/ParE family toxin [Arachidicoccus sp. BS20]ANI90292.1 hypothetical protein A9P82_13915 [Arachidicoccus sp. BS20]